MSLAEMTAPAQAKQYNLNDGQQKAATAFMEFLFGDQKEFIISGAAGVGKTYLMDYIIDKTLPQYHETCQLVDVKPEFNGVVMTATTNKAAHVLGQSVNRPTETTYSFFNLVVRNDYTNGKSTIRKGRDWKIHQNKIIFVDEASMVDTELWKMLHEATYKCKIVYVGDHNQLPPVHEDLSPVYKQRTPMVTLTQPVRNANQPALMDVCQQLRDTVETGEFKPIKLVPGVIDLLDGPAMQLAIDNHFAKQTHEARILAFTNKRVVEYNQYIRSMRKLPDSFMRGEYLVSSNAWHGKKSILPVEAGVTVRHNAGADKILIDQDHQIYLDVDRLDLEDDFGSGYRDVPVPTNREHYAQLIKYYGRQKNWERSFFLKEQFSDLRQRDAATVHKAQGSTYDTVFIDIGNISTCNIPNQVARLLYVAFSRAKTRVFLFGDLAPKYGGLEPA